MKTTRTRKTSAAAWDLSRRDLLRGLGVGAACVPLLWAPRPASAAPLKRFVCTLVTGGYRQATWRPVAGPLTTQALPSSLSPLEPHKADLIVLPALRNPAYVSVDMSTYGTIFHGQPGTTGDAYPAPKGKTVDQVIAGGLPGRVRSCLPLQVQLDLVPSQTAPGATRCFWSGPGLPVTPLADPVTTYRTLFAGFGTDGGKTDPQQLLADRRSILDYVGAGLQAWKSQLASDDRISLDGHIQAIRDLEGQLGALGQQAQTCAGTAPGSLGLSDKLQYPLVLSAQIDLIVAALRCGVTQVATLQLSDAVGANIDLASYVPGLPQVAGGQTLKDVAHNPIFAGLDRKAIVDTWFMQQLAHLIARMKAAPEGGGTMLDNSVVLWGNDMADGATRDGQNIPWILAGKCGGSLATGTCVLGPQTTSSVLADLCTAMGAPAAPFGASLGGVLV